MASDHRLPGSLARINTAIPLRKAKPIPCPRCHTDVVRIETTVSTEQSRRSVLCGRCGHHWDIPNAVSRHTAKAMRDNGKD